MSSDERFERGLRALYETSHQQELRAGERNDEILAAALDEGLSERSATHTRRLHPEKGPPEEPPPVAPGFVFGKRRWLWGAMPVAAAAALFVFLSEGQRVAPRAEAPYGGAEVTELGAAELEWQDEQDTLLVRSGAVRVSVEPAAGQVYRVRTQRFQVVVTGTVFEVHPQQVRVLNGSVRVEAQGQVLARVEAGESWSYREQVEAVPAPAPPRASASEPSPDGDAPVKRTVDVEQLLERAQEHIRRGEAKSARELLERALAVRGSEAQMARVRLLLADVSQLEGKRGDAERLYQKSAGHEEDAAQAQAALFSAARLAAERGETDRARELFLQYVKRYPEGPLRREAQRRVRELE